ncbi:tetratricopeptide repeat protein [Galbibacter sp. EGI 63066]|uniref:tetratricopeptide repeat protein n=1 Tax=Galbibacter sp. EGI 63066 TaxID=2993559 RepID=UPI00224898C8|nr:tetratricopeptide repeat protein [Galbibacter sp. EGI 63066]MCX2680335.1 tetratricopeptide repeat protein [Galbibacter sp. EGI 63066]
MKEEDYILFEDYLSGNLSEKETTLLEQRLETDEQLAASFRLYKELSGYLEKKVSNEDEAQAFEENLKKIAASHSVTNNRKSEKRTFKPWHYAIAASILIVFGLFLFKDSGAPVYADYAQHESISLTVRGEGETMLYNAQEAFNNKEYKKAVALFERILKEDISNSELQLYLAVSLVETNQFDKAENILAILAEGDSVYKYKAIWIQALSALKQKEYKACVALLKAIPKNVEEYDQAQKLMGKLP